MVVVVVAVGIIAAHANSVQKKYYKNDMQVIHGERRKKSEKTWTPLIKWAFLDADVNNRYHHSSQQSLRQKPGKP